MEGGLEALGGEPRVSGVEGLAVLDFLCEGGRLLCCSIAERGPQRAGAVERASCVKRAVLSAAGSWEVSSVRSISVRPVTQRTILFKPCRASSILT